MACNISVGRRRISREKIIQEMGKMIKKQVPLFNAKQIIFRYLSGFKERTYIPEKLWFNLFGRDNEKD